MQPHILWSSDSYESNNKSYQITGPAIILSLLKRFYSPEEREKRNFVQRG